MAKIRKFRPELECLEGRLPLSGDLFVGPLQTSSDTALTSDSTSPTTSDVIDPTPNPSDPSTTTISATVTALGPTNPDGTLQSIDVSGIPDSLAGATPTLIIGNVSYTVEFVIPLDGGVYRLVTSTGIDPTSVSVGSTVTLDYTAGSGTPTP